MKQKLSTIFMVGLAAIASGACAGSGEPAQSPQATAEADDPPEAQEPMAMQTPDEPEPAPIAEEEPAAAESASATAADFNDALQVVIADDALLGQLQLGEPGRFPLKISGTKIPRELELQAHAKNVEVVDTPEKPEEQAVLIFTDIELSGNKGTFKYRYPIEGVRGTSYVMKADGRWVLKSSRVSQY